MPLKISADEWKPIGVANLEPAATDVVRSDENTLVVAGPGAGKTELLAQRACFLLQTGRCPSSKRILAISFKRDAARNLADRVRLRCGTELGSRFHSFTFDAFSKSLVDRFRAALPERYAVGADYQISFELGKFSIGQWVRESLPSKGSTLDDAARRSINGERLYEGRFIGEPLTLDEWKDKDVYTRAAAEIWRYMLTGPPELTFPMMARLSDCILRFNPKILAALRASYAYVFLDEFQDTSAVHYDLTSTAFLGSSSIITAVGDNKQRVNKWAGALDGIFERFETEFDAEREHLLLNYRSAPELVRVQAFVAAAIDSEAPPAMPAVQLADGEDDGECLSFEFSSHETEAKILADKIKGWIETDDLTPRDLCVMTRQRPAHYAKLLQETLAELGINSRVENELQDLVAEPLTIAVVHVLRIVSSKRAPASWSATLDLLAALGSELNESEGRAESQRLAALIKELQESLSPPPGDEESVLGMIDRIMRFFGEAAFRAYFQQYGQGTFFQKTKADVAKELALRFEHLPLKDSLDDFEGVNSVPIMTMHKSKGLEYHTVVFVGLEDAALKGFAREPTEETCGFFVALSRAKRRVVFTFAEHRATYNTLDRQRRQAIKPLYDILEEAGIHSAHLG